MRRKIFGVIAAALMTLSASSAFAAFADLELIRVYYDRNGSEVATDLGKVKDIFTNGMPFAGSFAGLTQTATGYTGYAAYFALDRTASQLWASGKVTAPSVIVGGATGLTSLKNGSSSMYALYNTQGGTQYTGPAAATSSFRNKLSATQGWLANSISAAYRLNTEVSLANVISAGSVTQSLYFWDNALTTVAAEKVGVEVAIITTNADGSTNLWQFPEDDYTPIPDPPVVPNTPIPPSFFLMGSGLLGMVGLRRRASA